MLTYKYIRYHTRGEMQLPEWYTLQDALISARRDVEENRAYPVSIEDSITGIVFHYDDILAMTDVRDDGTIEIVGHKK